VTVSEAAYIRAMRDDLKAAIRSLASSRSFSIAALIVLTLSIGASTALFSVVDAVVLRGLPFDEHDRLVALGDRQPQRLRVSADTRDPDALSATAPQNYVDWAAQQRVFESMAAIASGWLTLHQPGAEPESLVPQYVTAEFFAVLRVRPAIGRAFTADNELEGRSRVLVLSDALWRRAFASDPTIVGRTITLDDIQGTQGAYEVLGVMPPGFAYPVGSARATDAWLPYVVPPEQRLRTPGSRYNYLQVIARLKDRVSLEHAQAQMDQIAVAVEMANPRWNQDNRIGVRPLVDHIVGARTQSWMMMLLGAVGIVLLIACANVANLFLARATSREREMGIRAAVGASRPRLVRQMLTESLVLAAAGTVCAVVIAWWAVGVLKASMPASVPRVTTIALDLRVLVAAAGLSLVTGLLFGIVPALQVSKPDVSNVLKGGRGSTGAARGRLRSGLVIAEVALAVVLLVGAALFIGSFVAIMRIDPGFSGDHVLTAQVSPRIESRAAPRDSAAMLAEIVDRASRIPGVLHASVTGGMVPLQGGYSATSLTIPAKNIDLTAGEMIVVSTVTPDYHRALKIPLRLGRFFDQTDRRASTPVVIISESAAHTYFAGDDPIGRAIGVDGTRTIVGVVGDVRQSSLEIDPTPQAYIPMAQATRVSGGNLVIRTGGNPYDVLPAVKAAVSAVLPDVPLRNVATMEELIGSRVAQRRFNMLLLGLFGVLGLVISTVGIYGLMAWVVSQRTREIGVRMALGATRSTMIAMVLRYAGALAASGVIVGAFGAWYLSAAAEAFLFGVEPTDPRAFAAALLLLCAAALVASLIPARRAATVDPMIVLRAE
jgi:putative ABC transport system permease protein